MLSVVHKVRLFVDHSSDNSMTAWFLSGSCGSMQKCCNAGSGVTSVAEIVA